MNNFSSDTATAAYFQAFGPAWQIARLPEKQSLPLLDVFPHRAVHPEPFWPVDFHCSVLTPLKILAMPKVSFFTSSSVKPAAAISCKKKGSAGNSSTEAER